MPTLILINCNINDSQLPYLVEAGTNFETLTLDVDTGAELFLQS